MSGPYNYDYLIPEIKIPIGKQAYDLKKSLTNANNWLHENFETLNCMMKNPFTGTSCFSDNSSIITVLISIFEFHEIDGLENLPKGTIQGERLSLQKQRDLIEADEHGNLYLWIGPHYRPHLWNDADDLIEAANRAKTMLLEQDPRLIEPVRTEIGWAIGMLDLNEFLPENETVPTDEYDGSNILESHDTLDERAAALIGASGFAAIAIEAERLRAQGAAKLAFLTADDGFEFRSSPFDGDLLPSKPPKDMKTGTTDQRRLTPKEKKDRIRRRFRRQR